MRFDASAVQASASATPRHSTVHAEAQHRPPGEILKNLRALEAEIENGNAGTGGDVEVSSSSWDQVPLTAVRATEDDIKCGPFGTQISREEFRTEGVPLSGTKRVNRQFELRTHEFPDPRTAKRLMQNSRLASPKSVEACSS